MDGWMDRMYIQSFVCNSVLKSLCSLEQAYQILSTDNELIHSLLPHSEHLRAFAFHQRQLLQHHFLRRLNLSSEVKLSDICFFFLWEYLGENGGQ